MKPEVLSVILLAGFLAVLGAVNLYLQIRDSVRATRQARRKELKEIYEEAQEVMRGRLGKKYIYEKGGDRA